MEDLLKFAGGAVLQGLVDAKKYRKHHKPGDGKPGKGVGSVCRVILIILVIAAAAGAVFYFINRLEKPGKGKNYSFLPFGHRDEDEDPDEEEYQDDPEIVKDLDQDT